ncbi:uncharacterized protein N7500_009422 [Penicillium coprophilum]|uniref:uncharacterized protein n=1 Tax=Penicillium coprophilum TaxID=36646 RepID=UPI002396E91B|nr:uncharacterized protein N7500_009422 [Penicillium coprophilum]KAJ5153983.1 hypothetical protein N7500_009422 [Penicillium coprophilum]
MYYWVLVLTLYNQSIIIYPAEDSGRDVFALGSIIGTKYTEIDYSYANTNEIEVINIAKIVLKDVRVPKIYFIGKTSGYCVSYRLAISFASLKGILQRASTQYTSIARLYQAYRWILGSLLRINDNKIVGLIDWEIAGFFGWKTAREVYRKLRPHDTSF